MGEAFITRRGGTAVGTAAPSINFISSTFDSITFTITNNDALTADIFWEIGDSTPDANTLSLAGGATSSNQVASGLDAETSYTIFAFANAEGKAGSQTSSIVQTTPEAPIVYTAATGGTTLEYDDGGKRYKSHTFTSDGTFTVTTVGDVTDDRNKVDYLIIAGGGGGGVNDATQGGGGGGAGGYQTTVGTSGADSAARDKIVVTVKSFSIDVGAGGGGGAANVFAPGSSGTNSVFDTITSLGGGFGGGGGINANEVAAGNGGSGGGPGGSRTSAFTTQTAGGTGTANQGRNGGSMNVGGRSRSGAGGGGANTVGGNAQASTNDDGGNGGNGLANSLRTGTNETRAGGGGGGGNDTPGTGGTGGGGNGGGAGSSGTANTGSGGGGSNSSNAGGNGGSGIVVIRYEIAPSV